MKNLEKSIWYSYLLYVHKVQVITDLTGNDPDDPKKNRTLLWGKINRWHKIDRGRTLHLNRPLLMDFVGLCSNCVLVFWSQFHRYFSVLLQTSNIQLYSTTLSFMEIWREKNSARISFQLSSFIENQGSSLCFSLKQMIFWLWKN